MPAHPAYKRNDTLFALIEVERVRVIRASESQVDERTGCAGAEGLAVCCQTLKIAGSCWKFRQETVKDRLVPGIYKVCTASQREALIMQCLSQSLAGNYKRQVYSFPAKGYPVSILIVYVYIQESHAIGKVL